MSTPEKGEWERRCEELHDIIDRQAIRVENLVTQVGVFTRNRDAALKAAVERIVALEADCALLRDEIKALRSKESLRR